MADTMITRCPDCGTAFQITQAQLDAACGSVRCGSCLHIFDASAYLVKPETESPAPVESAPPDPDASPAAMPVDPESLTADGQPLPKPAPGRPDRARAIASVTRTPPRATAAAPPPARAPAPKPPPPAAPRAPLPEEVTQQPLELEARRRPRWPRLLFWGALNTVLLALLAGQVVYLKFDDLRIHPTVGGWLEQACRYMDCPKPLRNEVRLLRAEQLVVRTHPDISGALQVDAMIINRARFSQPYPAIELEFSDLDGERVAGRRFLPEEYLSDYSPGEDFMGPGQSRHIRLGITDPGEVAVNYMITLHPLNPR